MPFCFYYWIWTGKYRFERLSKMENLCVLVPLFRSSLFRMVPFFLYFNLPRQPPEVFCKKKCFQKFRRFHRKTPVLESLSLFLIKLQACNFIKKRLQNRCFPVKSAKFLRTRLLLNFSGILRSYMKQY